MGLSGSISAVSRAIPAAVVAGYLLLALRSAGKSLGSDEIWFLLGPKELALSGIPWRTPDGGVMLLHPPLYPHLLALSYQVFGFHVLSVKLVGILCALGALWATARHLSSTMSGACGSGLALALIALNPAFVQGSVLLDSDNTLLSLLLLLFVLGWIRLEGGSAGRGGAWGLGLLFGASLWTKLTTPPFLAVLLIGFLAIRRHLVPLKRLLLPALGIGVVLFAGTFWAYCRWKGLLWTQPFDYLLGAAAGKAALSSETRGGVEILKSLVELVLWIQPSLAFLFGWAVLVRAREIGRSGALEAADLLWVFGGALLIGYLVVGGTNFGFPRYSFPALIPICLVAWRFGASSEIIHPGRWGSFLLLWASLAVFEAVVVGDPLYTWRYVLREAQIERVSLAGPIATLGGQLVVGIGLPLLAWVACARRAGGRHTLRAALFFTVLTQSAGLDVAQAIAGSNTNYNYGETGTRAVVTVIARALPPGQRVVATMEVTGLLAWDGVPTRATPDVVWNDAAVLEAEIRNPTTAYVVYSVTSNTIAQHRRTIADPRVQAALWANFEPGRIGGYTLWRRVR